MLSKKFTTKTTIAMFAAALFATFAASPASAGGGDIFLPTVQSNRPTDDTTLDELKACIKDAKANDACEITNAMITAYKKAGLGDTVPFKIRNRAKGTDQAVFVRFEYQDKQCDIGWHIQRDFWWSECKGPLYGDGGPDTIFVVPVPLENGAYRFILAIGSEAGAGRAGNIISYSLVGDFWIVDWYGQAQNGLCPIDNPYTEENESLCVH